MTEKKPARHNRPECIVALDVESCEIATNLVKTLPSRINWFKVGLQLFVKDGKNVISMLKSCGKKVFLDLKFHDIPNTVANAVTSAAALNIEMLTLHSSGGETMLRAARKAADQAENPPDLIAVTALTSLSSKDIASLGIGMKVESYAAFLATLAIRNQMNGIVCSPLEARTLRTELGSEPILITPGIRAAIDKNDDQQRTATAYDAVMAGSNFLVVGRPVVKADHPARAAEEILEQIDKAHSEQ